MVNEEKIDELIEVLKSIDTKLLMLIGEEKSTIIKSIKEIFNDTKAV